MTARFESKKTLIALYLLGMLSLNVLVYRSALRQVFEGYPDYSIFYTAGLMLRRGQGPHLYENSAQLQVQREFAVVAKQRIGPLPFNHPPFEGVLFVPLTRISYLASYGVWIGLNLILLVGLVLFLRKQLPELKTFSARMLLLALLAFFPLAYALMQGQDSIMLLTVYCLAFVNLRRGRDLQAGIWLGLGLFKFNLILPFVFILLLRRRWRTILGVAITGALELLISWLLIGWKELLSYPHYAWEVNRHSPLHVIVPENMANLRGLISGWARAQSYSPWPEIVVVMASLGVLIWAALEWDPANLRDIAFWNNGFAIAMIATFLASYHGYNQDMSILFLPVVLLSSQVRRSWAEGWYNAALKVGLGLMMFSPVFVILTLHFQQQHLFAIVLLGLTIALAAQNSALKRGIEKSELVGQT